MRRVCNLQDAEGTLVIDELGGGLIRSLFEGHFTLAHAEHVIAAATESMLTHGRVSSFHDWSALRRHEARARARLTKWSLETRASHDGTHILLTVESPILGMAVATTNLLLGDMLAIHTDRSSFDESFRKRQRR